MPDYIWIKNKRYYYYDTYNKWEKANKEAKRQKKRNGSHHFILKKIKGQILPIIKYELYLTKIWRPRLW